MYVSKYSSWMLFWGITWIFPPPAWKTARQCTLAASLWRRLLATSILSSCRKAIACPAFWPSQVPALAKRSRNGRSLRDRVNKMEGKELSARIFLTDLGNELEGSSL